MTDTAEYTVPQSSSEPDTASQDKGQPRQRLTHDEQSKTTPLHALHKQLGAKMVPFAGYEMPVQYPLGVKTEHCHTREHAGLFDVSHMGQLLISGNGITKALERLLPIDLEAMQIHQQSYALLTNEDGGILDDLIITRWEQETYFVVVNAACKEQDIAHFRQHLPDANIQILKDRALLALQGPTAKDTMKKIAPNACQLTFMNGCFANIDIDIDITTNTSITHKQQPSLDTAKCYITRSGYTGEDGFEISVPSQYAEAFARQLLNDPTVEAIGLGARDSLRLEAGLCLYGHDMNDRTTPIDASLLWSISRSRRPEGNKAGGFLGAEAIFPALVSHSSSTSSIEKAQTHQPTLPQKRVGLLINGRAPVREGALLMNDDKQIIGRVTSGGFGPTINQPVAIAYINKDYAAIGTECFAQVRGKLLPVTVSKMPFVPQRYFRG